MSEFQAKPERREFMRRSIGIVPAVLAVNGSSVAVELNGSASSISVGAQAAIASPTVNYTPTFLSADEWACVDASSARLIPSNADGPGAREAGVAEFIDRQLEGAFGHAASWYTQGPFIPSDVLFGFQGRMSPRDIYRAGIAALNVWCRANRGGKPFANLDNATQDAVLKNLESGAIRFEGTLARDFFSMLLQNTKEGYFSDPIHGGNKDAASWKMIGFPGARADFLDWVGKPAVVYPLPPVTISGKRG